MSDQRIIGSSDVLSRALGHASALAQIDRSILIVGERGSGKELFAERIHFLSKRWEGPLVKVNCAAMNDSLLDSELFGHEAGAFTGANKSHRGRFERAEGGTLFLDEIGSMSPLLQEKLLRVIEYGELERVGGENPIKVNVRVVGATHESLQLKVRKGQFRADLLDRLSFDVVRVPSLRERKEDIGELSEFFAFRFCQEMGWEVFPGFGKKALMMLEAHDWPGNIRELRNAVERSIFHHQNPHKQVTRILLDPFSIASQNSHPDHQAAADAFDENMANQQSDDFGGSSDDIISHSDADMASISGTRSLSSEDGFEFLVERFKESLLLKSLTKNQFNQKKTAEDLRLTYDQLRGLVKKYGLKGR